MNHPNTDTLATYLAWIEAEMRDMLRSEDPALVGHYGMMRYHMGWLDPDLKPVKAPTGKRIRPILCLLACEAAGGSPESAVPAAAALELLHNFSLIHDDIEDNSLTRRHRPTAWALWGMPLACNAGDGMFSLAHLGFQRLAARGVSPALVLTALRIFGETCVALTEGQYLDMSFERRSEVTPAEYYHMIAGKTGALLAASPEIGALIAGAPPQIVSAYRQYGAMLGRAFQLQDDILGIWGDETATGKSAASDILSKKKSLPIVYALSHPKTGAALAARYAGPAFSGTEIPAILELLDAAGARQYTERKVREATHEARQALATTAGGATTAAHGRLRSLLDSLVDRAT